MLKINRFNLNFQGFTLVELLITVTVVALLTTIALVSYTAFVRNSRDAKRQSDLLLIQSALEQYHADQSYYPQENTISTCVDGKLKFGCPLKNSSGSKSYLKELPQDPSGAASSYVYQVKPGGASCSDNPKKCKTYCLFAIKEGSDLKSQLSADCPSFPSGNYKLLVTPP